MDIQKLLAAVDHTLLRADATLNEIEALCADAAKYKTASVCVQPSYVAFAKKQLDGAAAVCTVIGFPLGCGTTETKVFETLDAVQSGADEIDMVINIGRLKTGDYEYVANEILSVRRACAGKILKVIIETCLLTDEEIAAMCGITARAGADYIKTSTGFSTEGATRHAVKLMRESSPPSLKIKAAGGIKTLADAEDFLKLGADRLGTSRVVALVKAMENAE